MLKKIYFFFLAGFISTEVTATSTNKEQLSHIRTQMVVIKRAWDSARIRIKMAEKASPALYQKIKPVFDKLLSNTDFITKLDTAVHDQFNSIVNNNMSFDSVKTEFNLSDFFPNLNMREFGKRLFSAMATKAYCFNLGTKLAQKMQELQIAITTTPAITSMPPQ